MPQFQKGESGNPAGRPKGSGAAAKIREAIEAHAEAIVKSLVVNALA